MYTWDQIISWDNVIESYNKTQKGSPKHKTDACEFRRDETKNLRILQDEISKGEFSHSAYKKFKVYEPKERTIFAPSYRDKILHHMIYGVLRDVYEPCFINNSYSCIRGRGNMAAAYSIQKELRKKSDYFIKMDIAKFFPSINRNILKRIIRKKIASEKTLDLCDLVIDSSPTKRGLPLGCVTSQLFANVYLNEVDKYIKHTLRIKGYVRYADDMFVFCKCKKYAAYVLNKIRDFLKSDLDLDCPRNKCYIGKCSRGVDGLGYKIYWDKIKLKSKAKNKFEKCLLKSKNINSINSWLGYAKVANCDTYLYAVCPKHGMRYDGIKINLGGTND